MTYYNVTFQWYDTTTYCSNIAHAGNVAAVEAHYREKHAGFLSITEASEHDVSDAKRRGKPIVEIATPAPDPEPVNLEPEKTLYLEKRGCDFWNDDEIRNVSDVGNYRVTTTGETIRGKDGNMYFLEFSRWDRYRFRTENKRTGEQLKKPVRELVMLHALHVDTEYTNERGSWGNISLEKRLHEKPMLYTLENILTITNEISADHYDRIEFVNR